MYRPQNGSPVYWVWQDGSPAITTKFTDTGDVTRWTPEIMIKRYGDPSPAFNNAPSDRFSRGDIERLMMDPHSYTFFRFPLDPFKPNLQGFIRTAVEKGNIFGITMETDQARSAQQAQDIAATLFPLGENTPLFKQYEVSGSAGDWPVKQGDSTDPKNPTVRKIMGPEGPFSKTVQGVTYYYTNPRKARPGDPWYNDMAPDKTTDTTENHSLPKNPSVPADRNSDSNQTQSFEFLYRDLKSRHDILRVSLSALVLSQHPPEGGGAPAQGWRQLINDLKQLLK